jgi:hypothetical protein
MPWIYDARPSLEETADDEGGEHRWRRSSCLRRACVRLGFPSAGAAVPRRSRRPGFTPPVPTEGGGCRCFRLANLPRGTRGSRLCGGDRDRETENSKVCARTRDTRFIQVRVAKVANPTSCLEIKYGALRLVLVEIRCPARYPTLLYIV